MVILHLKRGDESQFLYTTTVSSSVNEILPDIVTIHNGRLKVDRICNEIELLAEHGTSLPPEMHGLTDEQIEELNYEDKYGDECTPAGGFTINKDPCGRRNGKKPSEEKKKLFQKVVKEAKCLISKEQIKSNHSLTMQDIHDAIDVLRGSVMIVYPMDLPPYDPIRLEFENMEDLGGSQDEKQVLSLAKVQLWFAGKELLCDKKLSDYLGKNDKTKVIVKIQARGQGAPAREPLLTEEQRKALMMAEFKRREELKKLNDDDDNAYMNSEWSDSQHLRKSFQGLQNITWKPH